MFSDEVLPNLGADDITTPEPTVAECTDHEEGRADLLHHSWNDRKAQINGTLSHITAIFGFTLAGIVIDKIYREERACAEKNSNQSARHTINLYLCALNINKKKDNLLRSIWKNSLTPSA